MRKFLSLVVSATMGFLLLGNDVYAFFGPTHNNITNQAIAYLVAKEGYTASCPVYEKIADGSVKEDDPVLSMRSWFHFSPNLNFSSLSYDASADCDAITWAFSNGAVCKAKASILGENTLSNDSNWPNAVAQAGQDFGWIALGHVLHLLEDLAVPAHTRNDPHPWPRTDPLEEEAVELLPVLPDGQLILVSSPQDLVNLFQQLRNYSQSRFFSNDTVFQPGLPGPIDVREGNNYFYDEEGRKIAHKTWTYRFVTRNKRHCKIDPNIANEQFAELGPIAVRYAASLIKYYSNQTNAFTAIKCEDQKEIATDKTLERRIEIPSVPM